MIITEIIFTNVNKRSSLIVFLGILLIYWESTMSLDGTHVERSISVLVCDRLELFKDVWALL